MTTLPGDFVRLQGPAGFMDLNCHEYGIPWPPPEQITHVQGEELQMPFLLQHRSELTDDEALAERVERGALYLPIDMTLEGDDDDR